MTNDPLSMLVDAHERLAAEGEHDLAPMSEEYLARFADRGWVKFPLSASHMKELEGLVGFAFSPLLRRMLETRAAMPTFDVDVFGVGGWCGEAIFERNRDLLKASEDYGWSLPKFVAITADEDALAVTEDGTVIRICSNEGNIESEHGPLEGWLSRYASAAVSKAEGADPDDVWEDPEASFP